LERLVPTLRNDLHHELDRIRDKEYENYERISEEADPEENAEALARFLEVERDTALEIMQIHYLFSD
jgi:hypothetical protein